MKIGAYVVARQAKQAYAHESYDVRGWPGFEMLLDAARRDGYQIEYVGEATAHTCDVVLVSITSDCDWWPFIAERARWHKSRTRVIVGGSGVLNVRPFLWAADVFWFGRAEEWIGRLLEAERSGGRLDCPYVAYADTFRLDALHGICQAGHYYPHPFVLSNGKPYQESSLGCPNSCFFCAYTWHRRYIGDGTFDRGPTVTGGQARVERTIIDLLHLPAAKWQVGSQLRIVGLDGMSERVRYKANKRISREMWREFLRRLATIEPPHQVKVYNIVGYPDETDDDWAEFVSDIAEVDASLPPGPQWSLLCHFTPFRAMPATPSAGWPMSYHNYRGEIARHFKRAAMPGNVFFQGNRFWCVEGMGTDSLPTVVESALVWRGTEADGASMRKLALTSAYWRADMRTKLCTLEANFDCEKLFRAYDINGLPVPYLRPVRHVRGKEATHI